MWRLRRRRQELLDALALDELDEYRAAVGRIIGVAQMQPAQPSDGDGPPPNAPNWPTNRRGNQPPAARLTNTRDHQGPW